jgi:hypothetical protein
MGWLMAASSVKAPGFSDIVTEGKALLFKILVFLRVRLDLLQDDGLLQRIKVSVFEVPAYVGSSRLSH